MEEKDVEKIEEIVEQAEEQTEENMAQEEKSKGTKLTSWYGEYKKPIIGVLFALIVICWLTVKMGLSRGVLFMGKLGHPEYTDFYIIYRNEFLIAEKNLLMSEFKTILAIVGIILFLCLLFMPNLYERDKCPAACSWFINFTLIVLGFSLISYGVLVIGLYKILSVTSGLYVLLGVLCFLLFPLVNKNFTIEHPDKFEAKIGSYVCGILGVALIVAMGAGNVRDEMTSLSKREEAYHYAYKSILFALNYEYLEDTDNRIYLKVHFYNQYNTEGKNYEYEEVLESFYNYHRDDGSSWKVYKDFGEDYFDLMCSSLFDNYGYMRDAIFDYERLVQQKLYYDGYCYGFEYNQPEIPEEVMAQACQEIDENFLNDITIEKYDDDIEITVNGSLTVGENPSLDVSCGYNDGEYSAYIYNIARVNSVGADKYDDFIEVYNYKSQEEFIIQDDSVYLLKLMVASDLKHSFSEDINISVNGIEYQDITVTEEIFGYKDESLETECGAFYVYLWVTTGD